jgi:hypothetical protein
VSGGRSIHAFDAAGVEAWMGYTLTDNSHYNRQ